MKLTLRLGAGLAARVLEQLRVDLGGGDLDVSDDRAADEDGRHRGELRMSLRVHDARVEQLDVQVLVDRVERARERDLRGRRPLRGPASNVAEPSTGCSPSARRTKETASRRRRAAAFGPAPRARVVFELHRDLLPDERLEHGIEEHDGSRRRRAAHGSARGARRGRRAASSQEELLCDVCPEW